MPMDFNYTNRFKKYPNEKNRYHALTHCPEAEKIKLKHHEFGLPPATENRTVCELCVAEMNAWLDTV